MRSRATGKWFLALYVSANRSSTLSVYVPAIYVLNKIDAISIEELDLLYKVSSVQLTILSSNLS